MDWTSLGITAFGVLANALILIYIKKTLKGSPPQQTNGMQLLKPSKIYRMSAWVCILIALFFIIGLCFEPTLTMLGLSFTLGIGFGWSGIYMLQIHKQHRVLYNDSNVIIYNHKGESKIFNWEEVIKVKYYGGLDYLQFTTNRWKVKMQMNFVGIDDFLKLVEEKTDWGKPIRKT